MKHHDRNVRADLQFSVEELFLCVPHIALGIQVINL